MLRNILINLGVLFWFCVMVSGIYPAKAHANAFKKERKMAYNEYQKGNYKTAYEKYHALLLNKNNHDKLTGNDLEMALSCLRNLNRVEETDALRQDVVKIHANHWQLLFSAAKSYLSDVHYGYIVAGQFMRGNHRGGGKYVNSVERDRVQALQLFEKTYALVKKQNNKKEIAEVCVTYARALMSDRSYHESWRLQYLTDLKTLPDYEPGYGYYRQNQKGAPVTEDDTPVYYPLAASYKDCQNDGQRWRWLLDRAKVLNPEWTNQLLFEYAGFWHHQLGVHTMADYGYFFATQSDDNDKQKQDQMYNLHLLAENQTIARLANGIRKFELPDDANYIAIYKKIVDQPQFGHVEGALNQLAQIFEDRRQYDKAAMYWKKSIQQFGAGSNQYKQKKLDQIVDNWGRFEPVLSQPAGKNASIDYRFRNGSMVTLTAYKIKVDQILADVKDYLKSNPSKLTHNRIEINNIGYLLVQQNQRKYLDAKVAEWNVPLSADSRHFDRQVTIQTPLSEPGAYLLNAQMQGGNLSSIIVWLDNTAIVQKKLDNQYFFYIADASTGKPLADMNVEFFGYRQRWVKDRKFFRRDYQIDVEQFARYSDKNGQIVLNPKEMEAGYEWLVVATSAKRMAYLGFSNIWYGQYYDREYNQVKAFGITDRPVYRPGQTVNFNFWIRQAKYDQKDVSIYARKPFTVQIQNPKGEKVFEKQMTADAYAGISGQYFLNDDVTLGEYSISVQGLGAFSFRVEEYKKPEFEVIIKAPEKPVMLGDTIKVKIGANYYFGAPVQNAKVSYKILRTAYHKNWYPPARWDWFYGKGYWWSAYDYNWYPGWSDWGCEAPLRWWWPRHTDPPEIVAQAETRIGEDGTISVNIDTSFAKAFLGDSDHQYEIIAEVTDQSRRTIVGKGSVLVARKPFEVFGWVDKGYYRLGDVITASFSAQTLSGEPVAGKGKLDLMAVSYKDGRSNEHLVQTFDVDPDQSGMVHQKIRPQKAGQFRIAYTLTDLRGNRVQSGYFVNVVGKEDDSARYRFNDIELIPDKHEYAPGDKLHLMVNTNQADSTVLLFLRPANGQYLAPEMLAVKDKRVIYDVDVLTKDMPNFFIEAVTVTDGKVYTEVKEIIVPPEKRIVNVTVEPDQKDYRPGQKATALVKVTDQNDKPFVGSTVITVYDRAVEYISGGSNVPDIRAFFWKWRRSHHAQTDTNLGRHFWNLVKSGQQVMQAIGAFGNLLGQGRQEPERSINEFKSQPVRRPAMLKMESPMPAVPESEPPDQGTIAMAGDAPQAETDDAMAGEDKSQMVEPMIRQKFADTAFWAAGIQTDKNGTARIEFNMPENLSDWKFQAWIMGHGTIVGQGDAFAKTSKNVLVRLQAPRFFVETDEVMLSANIHNYLDMAKSVQAILELDGKNLECLEPTHKDIRIDAQGEKRVDWRVKVVKEGEAVIRMKALTDEESDAMQMSFPVYVHGMLKTDSYCGMIALNKTETEFKINVPQQRRTDQTRLEIRYSPTLAGAMVDALPYLADYPYGCTEQTLSRFLPSVITRNIIKSMGIDLKALQTKTADLDSQKTDQSHQKGRYWQHQGQNPVFDSAKIDDMVHEGVKRLTAMQLTDGGWGWFSGDYEQSYPHTTAYVVHGLMLAEQNGVAIVPSVLKKGMAWLEQYQADQLKRLDNYRHKTKPYKSCADNTDAFVHLVLTRAGKHSQKMSDYLYNGRNQLSVYGKAMLGLCLHQVGHTDQLNMILENIEQYLVMDRENQTAYLNLPNSSYWWYWYGSEIEAHAYYLKLLSQVAPKSEKAAFLVKYLLNNRKHATYWNSTRDTAICIEAMADYLVKSGENKPDMDLEIYIDGQIQKQVHISADNLFGFDNALIMSGKAITSGAHTITIKKKGSGPVYYNAYLTCFSLEDQIKHAGLEIKVDRQYYKLVQVDKTIDTEGSRGNVLQRKVEKYQREPIKNLSMVNSGDLVEIELTIESKNDYEYVIFEDFKPAGFEPVEVRSGYNGNDMGAYMELRDEKVCFFVTRLARGKHSVSYRMRAEIPGRFSALPAKAYAMYAPELVGNSDEIKLIVEDR